MIALPLYEMLELIVTGLGFIGIVVFFRLGTQKGWYLRLGKDKHGMFEIPQEAMDFNKEFGSEEYTIAFVKQGIVAMIWFYITFPIALMATVGGTVITDNNPLFKVPCILLILIMQFICIWKILMVMVKLVDDWILCTIGVIIIARTIEKEPMCIKMSRSRSAKKKDVRDLIQEETKKEVAVNV